MKKKIIFLSASAIAVSLIGVAAIKNSEPIKANAIEKELFYVGDHDMVAEPNYEKDGGSAIYDASKNTLTLTNFTYEGNGYNFSTSSYNFGYSALTYTVTKDLTIILKGTNVIKCTYADGQSSHGAYFDSSEPTLSHTVTFDGTGTLDISGSKAGKYSTAIYANSTYIKMAGGTVTAEGGTLKYTDSDIPSPSFGTYGLYSNYGLFMEGGILNTVGGESNLNSSGIGIGLISGTEERSYFHGGIVNAVGGKATRQSAGLFIGSAGEQNYEMTGGEIHAIGNSDSGSTYGLNLQGIKSEFVFAGGTVDAIGINKNPDNGYGISYCAFDSTAFEDTLKVTGDAVIDSMGSKYAVALYNDNSGVEEEGKVLNSVVGTGWNNVDKTGETFDIPVRTEATNVAYKAVHFEATAAPATYVTEPTPISGLVYTGKPQALINGGSSNEGTVVYRLGDSGEFSTIIPTATDVGTYTVQYKILGDESHSDSSVKSISVTIADAPVPPTPTPTPTNNGGLPGWGIALIVVGSVILLFGLCFLLLFFLLNKWIKEGDKAVRVLRFAFGKKDGKQRYLALSCKFVYRNKEEVFNRKEDALK